MQISIINLILTRIKHFCAATENLMELGEWYIDRDTNLGVSERYRETEISERYRRLMWILIYMFYFVLIIHITS